ncbi:hypothetical protein ALC56_12924 [Trachymyrmex septentrionalis]|uniref:Uncharacterized protein n=1 Tax=Trachymyrmex septentrionalis TaxID=34720 RepID=A0A151JTD2_9HYME|nr:hypothetical protein ALC56_12924 [Trachymyrmex septentrionalis]
MLLSPIIDPLLVVMFLLSLMVEPSSRYVGALLIVSGSEEIDNVVAGLTDRRLAVGLGVCQPSLQLLLSIMHFIDKARIERRRYIILITSVELSNAVFEIRIARVVAEAAKKKEAKKRNCERGGPPRRCRVDPPSGYALGKGPLFCHNDLALYKCLACHATFALSRAKNVTKLVTRNLIPEEIRTRRCRLARRRRKG